MIDFLGIGAQKSGTTWLYRHLSLHPQIVFPGGKECHFWDLITPEDSHRWLSIFNHNDNQYCLSIPVKAGEITPSYSLLKHDTIKSIRACAPRLLLFISLRNPIERAWSAACMDLCRCQISHEEAGDAWFLDHIKSGPSRHRGDYEAIIKCWLSVFPKEQLYILFFDDIIKDPHCLLRKLAVFLGVDPNLYPPDENLSMPVLPALDPSLQQLQARLSRPSLAKHPRVLETLHELYDHKITMLQNFLGMPLNHWIPNEFTDPYPACRDASEVGVGGPGFAMVRQLIAEKQSGWSTTSHA